MGYLHIKNLYKYRTVLLFKECYALEKIHGTSAHVKWQDEKLTFYSGGEKMKNFVALFDSEALTKKFQEIKAATVIIFGEAYGGTQQKMAATYGPSLKFVVFDVKIDNEWKTVPEAHGVATKLGLEFVHYEKVEATIEEFNKQRDADSVQAIRNGVGPGKTREGIVIRPLFEVEKNGERVIAKHKAEEFCETKSKREAKSLNSDNIKILIEAKSIAEEWVTKMRLIHVLDKIPNHEQKNARDIIRAMIDDIKREAKDEIVLGKQAEKEIASATIKLYRVHLLEQSNSE